MKRLPNASAPFAQSALQRGVRDVAGSAAGNVSRRHFLASGAGVGLAALGVAPLLASCGGSDDGPPARPTHERTLFVNLAHESHAGKTYYLTGGGRRFTLTPTANDPQVLARARQSNTFLRAVPDDQITHHVENATFASDSVTLCYISSEIDTQAGTWSMSAVQLYIPPAAAKAAHESARKKTPSGPLPLSAKRQRYGVAAASSEQDLREERELLDTTSHAATLVGCHPDLMGLDPNVAHTIQSNHVDHGSADIFVLGQKLSQTQYGPAMPETSGQPNANGWATLRPVPTDGLAGPTLKNTKGQHAGRNQYLPSLHPDLRTLARGAMNASITTVKDDTSIGADATGLEPPSDQPHAALAGAMWLRHDGTTKVDQSPGIPADLDAGMTLTRQNGQVGYKLVKVRSTQNADVTNVSLTILNFFLEFRGVWLQFFDGDKLLTLTDLPEYNKGTIFARDRTQLFDTETEMFVSVIGPVFTVLAIPTAPGFIHPSFNVPKGATTARILSSTMSFQGGNAYPDTVVQGAVMTGVFNYGATVMLAALGAAAQIPGLFSTVVVPYVQALTLELVNLIDGALNPSADPLLFTTAAFWENQALIVAKLLVTVGTTEATKALFAYMVGAESEGAAEDAIPVVGQMMMAISIAVGVISLAETTAELALTPWTYVDDLVFTHDLQVTILKDSGNPNANPPDPGDDTFPKAANSYTVTAMFDDGTPHVQTFPLDAPVSTLPPVVFRNAPLGGNVNVSVAFVQEAVFPGMPDILLGKGTTGLIPNDINAAPTITIEELAFPISSNTKYQHQQRTALDASGNHLWAAGPAPTANLGNTTCGAAGTLCGFGGISVRQGTGSTSGYVGYAWRGQDSEANRVPNCPVGQLDQIANLNTGTDAQLGYVNGGCGTIVPGVRVAYSLLSHGAANFYLDTTNPNAPMVRQVVLEPTPSIVGPGSGQAWGVLNFASDSLLLHPAGHLVSINRASHKIETHRLPKQPKADADAMVELLAQIKGGKGSRPGLLDLPVASAISADGVILILEAGNNRIQALDLGASPVRHFTKQPSPYSLTLGGTDPVGGWQYLDLAVEYTGYLYVLSFNQNTFEYRLDLYHPDQADTNPIATTHGINAARLTVDFWRNVYTLNYEVLRLPPPPPGGSAAPLTEPSVSLWTPCDLGQTC